ncbi:MAG: hypothetical protein JNK54_02755 [Elusimicrobia bacterium]|jgi:hypothetical protein|nr:hypothetical protein [Elusimicrobiota bacterium]
MNQQNIYRLPPQTKKVPPSWIKSGYTLGAVLIVLGFIVVGIAGGSVVSALNRGTHPVDFPGTVNLKLKSGLYVGLPAPGSSFEPNSLYVTVTEVATGESVPVQSGSDITVQVLGPQGGRPLFQFEPYEEGTYAVSGTASTPTGSLRVMLLHESLGRTRSDLVVGVLTGALLGTTGILVLWLVWRKRKKLLSTE